jgi:hypothetical protein
MQASSHQRTGHFTPRCAFGVFEGFRELHHVHLHVTVTFVPVHLGRRLHIEYILQCERVQVLVST